MVARVGTASKRIGDASTKKCWKTDNGGTKKCVITYGADKSAKDEKVMHKSFDSIRDKMVKDGKSREDVARVAKLYHVRTKEVDTDKKLTTKARKHISSENFAIPEEKAYPIENREHGANALSRVATNGTPAEKKRVKRKVCAKYKTLPSCKK